MYILLNLPRLICYGLVLAGTVWGECPWWVLPALISYDITRYVKVKIPWMKAPPTPDPIDKVSLQQLMQLRATMEKQNGGVNH